MPTTKNGTTISKKHIAIVMGLVSAIAGSVWGVAEGLRSECIEERDSFRAELAVCHDRLLILTVPSDKLDAFRTHADRVAATSATAEAQDELSVPDETQPEESGFSVEESLSGLMDYLREIEIPEGTGAAP